MGGGTLYHVEAIEIRRRLRRHRRLHEIERRRRRQRRRRQRWWWSSRHTSKVRQRARLIVGIPLVSAVLVHVGGEGLDVVGEPERGHGEENVVGSDGLAIVLVTFLVGFAHHVEDELGGAVLNGLLGILLDLGDGREGAAHQTVNAADGNAQLGIMLRRDLVDVDVQCQRWWRRCWWLAVDVDAASS
ncbi:uncharacterized protein LOC127254673 [Andrographis paniculata]|uniref:uncharacterized protein LOC127254673 n=1 Tax=Andrographis paniculata TaxID=175694 RepID=UPI0021E75749|nr:uncharacterized protein LOC127254673 [Andrographis paniculata]